MTEILNRVSFTLFYSVEDFQFRVSSVRFRFGWNSREVSGKISNLLGKEAPNSVARDEERALDCVDHGASILLRAHHNATRALPTSHWPPAALAAIPVTHALAVSG